MSCHNITLKQSGFLPLDLRPHALAHPILSLHPLPPLLALPILLHLLPLSHPFHRPPFRDRPQLAGRILLLPPLIPGSPAQGTSERIDEMREPPLERKHAGQRPVGHEREQVDVIVHVRDRGQELEQQWEGDGG